MVEISKQSLLSPALYPFSSQLKIFSINLIKFIIMTLSNLFWDLYLFFFFWYFKMILNSKKFASFPRYLYTRYQYKMPMWSAFQHNLCYYLSSQIFFIIFCKTYHNSKIWIVWFIFFHIKIVKLENDWQVINSSEWLLAQHKN